MVTAKQLDSMLKKAANGKNVVVNDWETQNQIDNLVSLGDERFDNYIVSRSNGTMSVMGLPKCSNKNNDNGQNLIITREVTEKGITVPKALLDKLSNLSEFTVYLRPLNDYSFLVNATKGNNKDTIPHGRYSDGRVCISRTTMSELLPGCNVWEGDTVTFQLNGNTKNSILVTLT